MQLYDYQQDCVANLLTLAKEHRRIILTVPTGGGKTIMASAIASNFIERGKTCIFVAHRKELVAQTRLTMRENGFASSTIEAGVSDIVARHGHDLKIAMVNTLHRRLMKWKKADRPPPWKVPLLIWDEAHHIAANTWAEISEYLRRYNPHMLELGLTATPARRDGKPLGNHFDMLLMGPSCGELIEAGYLSPFRAFAPTTPLRKLRETMRTQAGDFHVKEQAEMIKENHLALADNAIRLYQQHSAGEPAIFYGVDIAHSKRVAGDFAEAGITAEHVDGEMHINERERIIEDFRTGRCLVLCNVGIVSEGFDVPAATTVIFGRSTKSLTLWLQACGRCLRYQDGKMAKIIDQGWNIERLGLPSKQHDWSLDAMTDAEPGYDAEGSGESRTLCPSCEEYIKPTIQSLPNGDRVVACPDCNHQIRTIKVEIQELAETEVTEVGGAGSVELARELNKQRGLWKAEDLDRLARIAHIEKRRWQRSKRHRKVGLPGDGEKDAVDGVMRNLVRAGIKP